MKGHVARKRFGQNFLVDSGIISRHRRRRSILKRSDATCRNRPWPRLRLPSRYCSASITCMSSKSTAT